MKDYSSDRLLTSRTDSVEALRNRDGLILGTSIFEPISGREDVYRPHESTPLLSNDTLDSHQSGVRYMVGALIDHELGHKVSDKVLKFIHHSIQMRMLQRDGSNSVSYTTRLHDTIPNVVDEELRNELIESCTAAENGTASMYQSDMTRRALGMASVEYGNLTIIGDKRAEHLPDMYDEASELLGKNIAEVEPYRIEVIGFDREPDGRKNNHLGAMRIKMKRHLGYLDDGTEVKQRTLAIIDMSQKSGMDPSITKAIFEAHERERIAKEQSKLARACMKLTAGSDEATILSVLNTGSNKIVPVAHETDYAKLFEVNMMIQELMNRDMTDSLVLARNETIYGYNKETDDLIHRKSALKIATLDQ